MGQKETLQYKQDVGTEHPWTFDALNMSDGTLRVLGVLLAVYQPGYNSLIAIEEPEATVHPAIAELVIQALMDAASERQVLVATHSPDILDYEQITDTHIRVVTMEHGDASIAPASRSSRKAIRDDLYTPGELLRLGELNPDIDAAKAASEQMSLFGPAQFGEPEET